MNVRSDGDRLSRDDLIEILAALQLELLSQVEEHLRTVRQMQQHLEALRAALRVEP